MWKSYAAVWLLRGSTLLCRFLLTVLAVRLLPLAEFGTYGLLTAGVAIGVYLLGLQFYTFNLRELASTGDPLRRARHIRDQLAFHALVYVGLLPVGLWLQAGSNAEATVWLVVLVASEHVSQEGYRVLVALSRAAAANALYFVRSGLWVLGWIGYGLSVGTPTLRSLCAFWLAGTLLSVALTAVALRSLPWRATWSTAVDWAWIRRGLRTCAVYSGIVVFFAVAQYVGRYVLEATHGPAAVGVFFFFVSMAGPAYTLAEVGPYSILQPRLLQLYASSRGDYGKALKALAAGVALTGGISSLGVAVVTLAYIRWAGRSELEMHGPTLGLVCFGTFLSCLILVPQAHLFTLKADRRILAANFCAMLLAVSATTILIPRLGIVGAAWSAVLTSGGGLLVMAVLAARRAELAA